jgi:hypothetical protein
MRTSHAITVWIFDRLDLDGALAGDLLEESARGRSTLWYWRQVLTAIWTGIWSAVFAHKMLALRALATGCAANAVWLFLWMKFLHFGLSFPPPYTKPLLMESIAYFLILLLTQTATGWIVARTHRTAAIPMVVVFITWLTLWFFIDTFSEDKRLLLNSIDQPGLRPYLAWYLTPIAVEIVGLLCGGILGSRRQSGGNRLQTGWRER